MFDVFITHCSTSALTYYSMNDKFLESGEQSWEIKSDLNKGATGLWVGFQESVVKTTETEKQSYALERFST